MREAVVETVGLKKRYRSLPVLDGLSLRVEPGEVFALLGPNGAGKSTLIHLLLGFIRPDAGEIRVLGRPPGLARRVGYLPERVRYHAQFAPREYLRHLGRFSDLRGRDLEGRIDEVLTLVDLVGVADRRLGTFSKGMLQRLGLAQALLPEPDLLLVDEPTSGLDPAGQREVLDILVALRRRGHTILACTHQLPEVALLADRVGVLKNGALATSARLSDLPSGEGVLVALPPPGLTSADAAGIASIGQGVSASGREVRILGDARLQRLVLQRLLDLGLSISELRPIQGGVEAMYLEAMRDHTTRDGRAGVAAEEVGS